MAYIIFISICLSLALHSAAYSAVANAFVNDAAQARAVANASAEHVIQITKRAAPTCTAQLKNYDPDHILCQPSSPSVTKKGVSAADQTLITDLHNKHRAAVSPTAETMYKIYWDPNLAVLAQKAVEQCKFDHLGHDNLREHAATSYGENIAQGEQSWTEVVNDWHGEKANFKLGQGSVNGEDVGHYTQVVQSTAGRIGCGFAECSNLNAPLYVCKYITGQEDYNTPYTEGKPCSSCASKCSNNLCDCGGKMCFNEGKLNLNTCECACGRSFSGPTCEIPDCNAADFSSDFCSNPADCFAVSNMAKFCPKMCKIC